MTQPTIHTKTLIPEPTAQDQEERLKDILTKVYELLDEAKALIPFFKAVVEYEGRRYWAELEMHKNPMQYPDLAQAYWAAKFGLPNAHGFFYGLFELDRSGLRPYLGKEGNMREGNIFNKALPIIKHSVRIEKLKVIKMIC